MASIVKMTGIMICADKAVSPLTQLAEKQKFKQSLALLL